MRSSDDIALIGWSVSPMVRNTDKTEAQMLLEVITGAVEDAGITRREVDFTCAGSCDYVAGQAFSFVQNIDAIGAWPPKRDSHVEMDGAWAMYEAWIRLQLGDIDVAVAMGSGRSSTADPALIYPMERSVGDEFVRGDLVRKDEGCSVRSTLNPDHGLRTNDVVPQVQKACDRAH